MKPQAARRPLGSCADRKRDRSGYSLIELLAVISLNALLCGIVVATMASLLRFDRNVTQHVDDRSELQRFTAAIRTDLHQATEVQWNASEQIIKLDLPGQQSIQYQVVEGRWVRLADTKGGATKRTVYALRESLQCLCEPEKASLGTRIKINFNSNLNDSSNQDDWLRPALQGEIIATLGRDHNLLSE